jgi:tartrate-resistant acid phosphatase type 5
MRFPGISLPVLMVGLAVTAARGFGDEAPPAPSAIESIASRLPPDIADAARKWLREDKKDLKAARAFSDKALEQAVVVDLASEKDAAQFILGRLAGEPSTTVVLVLKQIAFDAFWPDVPGLAGSLEHLAAATSDPDLMLAYMDSERRVEVKLIRRTLTARIAAARASGDAKELEMLARADERWMIVERGASLPAFMRVPPPVFAVKPADQPIRLVGMGDFGAGSSGQRDVAAEIVRMGTARPFDFGVTFGDNFYPTGMRGTDDPRWRDWWEALYGPLHIMYYPTLGNHEWYADDGAAAEIAYHSPTWDLPSLYYTYTAGPVQFFALDTTEVPESEILWLDKAIAASTAKWKVVYGHHPIFAPEHSAKSGIYMRYMQARLWPVIRGRVDAYLCGHQHAMAHMAPQEGVHFFMSGGGGGELNRVSDKGGSTLFAESTFGFLTLEADAASMRIAIFDTDGKAFDSEVITK